jgi:heavy metal sensor kinase
MSRLLHSIRFRLTFWFVGILAVTILLISAAVYLGLRSALLANVDQTLRRAAERSVQTSQQNPLDPAASAAERARALTYIAIAPTRLLLLDGSITQSDPLFPADIAVDASTVAAAQNGQSVYETIDAPNRQYRMLTAPLSVEGRRFAVIQVAQSLDTELNTLESLRRLLWITVPVTLILATIGGVVLSQNAFAPMERVRRSVEAIIADNDLSHRVGTSLTDDEVGRLAQTFDRLLERIQGAMNRERQFSADASHELRSPLTALKGELSVTLARPRTAEEYRHVLEQLEDTVDEMSLLVEDLLSLSRATAGILRVETFDIAQLLAHTHERLNALVATRGLTLATSTEPASLPLVADRLKIQRVLTNLIDNAIRYTPRGGGITARIYRDDAHVCIEVADTGIGIAAEHLPHVFERFYRADNARTRDGSGGSGLGLAIADAIVRAHGGRITVRSTLGRGTTFTVSLPQGSQPPE